MSKSQSGRVIAHDIWAFTVSHDFADEQNSFIKDIEKREDISRLFYGKAEIDNEFTTKGLVWFEKSVSRKFVASLVWSPLIFATANWYELTNDIRYDKRFNTHEIRWMSAVPPPLKLERAQKVDPPGREYF